ncbi:hypothetical protein [Streptomyces sp. NPDC057877]|uniref:hypothetical protein n=1 Tax=Streptomyces sp. NPDC057877 TaxID=3346269 RepID=UPI0036C3AF45
MEPELATLVGAGATTVVSLMVTEGWGQVKQRLVRLFARGDDADSGADTELEESRAALVAAAGAPDEADLTADVRALLRLRLRRLLEQDPGVADELRLLLAEFAPDANTGTVHNSITGGTQHGPVFQGQSFSNLNFRVPDD